MKIFLRGVTVSSIGFTFGLLCLLAANTLPAAPAAIPVGGARVRTDRIIVKPKANADAAAVARLQANFGLQVSRTLLHLRGLQIVQLPPMANVSAILTALNRNPLVEYAEPDYELVSQAVPNDFRYYNLDQWNLTNTGQYGGTVGGDIHAAAAWDVITDASSVVVAVVDTGVRTTHEDLASNLWTNPGESGLDALGRDKRTNGLDDDANGWVDDVHGINTLNGSGNPWDDFGHGTHVSGVIGAATNNSVGVAGIAWKVQLMELKFIDSAGHGSIADAVICLDYARAKGAKVVQASWGNYNFASNALSDAITALGEAGIIMVCAAGNNGINNDSQPLYPASYPHANIIAVGATERTDARAAFSNYGQTTVDLAAPGNPVYSCWNGSDSDYRNWDGTSMAAPHVSGACALLIAKYPNESHASIIARVLQNADAIPSYAGLTVTGGRLNLAAALTAPPPNVGGSGGGTPPGTVWFNDDIPTGAWTSSSGGDAWNWITSNPTPFAGARAHQSNLVAGTHDHSFTDASATLTLGAGENLYAYVYVDPANPPQEIMLSFNAGNWEHRAYWGANLLSYGTNGTASRRYVGAIPAGGQWVRLEVPASDLDLVGAPIKGMSFTLVGGRVTWDAVGKKLP